MSYSYRRALQQSAPKYWAKDTKDMTVLKKFLIIGRNVFSGSSRKWSKDLEDT